jgi:hypothetical protein
MRKLLCGLVSSLCMASVLSTAAAKTQMEADPVHYKLEFENECVRVSRGTFGPHEKMPTFFDPQSAVLVFLTDSAGFSLTFPDGRQARTDRTIAGTVIWADKPERVRQENAGDSRLEFLVIEPKKGCK